MTLDLEATCNSDLDRAMKLVVWDHRKTGKHKQMGEFETAMQGFINATLEHQGVQDFGFTLVTKGEKEVGTIPALEASVSEAPKSKQNGAKKGSGDKKKSSKGLQSPSRSKPKAAVNCNQANRPEFVDCLSGGHQTSLAVAIDFTASNGDPSQPGTLHHFHPPKSKEWSDCEKSAILTSAFQCGGLVQQVTQFLCCFCTKWSQICPKLVFCFHSSTRNATMQCATAFNAERKLKWKVCKESWMRTAVHFKCH